MFAMLSSAGGGIILILAMLVILPLALLSMVFWIWMLIHAIQNKGLTDNERIVWVLVIVFVHLIGALIYFFVGRPKGIR